MRPRCLRALLTAALLALAGTGGAGLVSAQVTTPAASADWEPTGIDGPFSHIAISRGVVYALAPAQVQGRDHTGAFIWRSAALWRGDNRGTSWSTVTLPVVRPSEQVHDLAVSLEDARVVYIAGEKGVYRSGDGGTTWSLSLAAPEPEQEALRLALSPADPTLLYAATGYMGKAALWRSTDAGANWQQVHRLDASLCRWWFPVLAPDPAVRERIYSSFFCAAGRSFGAELLVSEDMWTTIGVDIRSGTGAVLLSGIRGFLYPQAAAFDPARERGVALAWRDVRVGGSELLRTDDGGQSWRRLLDYPSATAATFGHGPYLLPDVLTRALSVDGPDLTRIFLGLGDGFRASSAGRGVLGSLDGGAIWGPVGARAIGSVHALALDAQANVLYAGTDRGLWRMPQPRPSLNLPRGPIYGPWRTDVVTALGTGADEARMGIGPLDIGQRRPYALAIEPSGGLLVAAWPSRDSYWPVLTRLRAGPDGALADVAVGVQQGAITALAARADGALVFSARETVQALGPSGEATQLAGRFPPPSGPVDRDPKFQGPALEAPLTRIAGVTVDAGGAVYVADAGSHVVRRIAPDGTISTVAGTGRAGWRGDGLPATEAELDEPWGLALDREGRLLIADRAGQRVVRLEADGTLATVAGGGVPGYAGDGGSATQARLAFPTAITVDDLGRIYIADTLNHAVRMVDVDGRIWTLAGKGAPGKAVGAAEAETELDLPMAVAWGGAAGLYVADFGNNRVLWIGMGPAD